jgi:hypothetical protein
MAKEFPWLADSFALGLKQQPLLEAFSLSISSTLPSICRYLNMFDLIKVVIKELLS